MTRATDRVWPPPDRRERIPGGWMFTGDCGGRHLAGPGHTYFRCPICDEPPATGCALCTEIDYLNEWRTWPTTELADRLGVSQRTIQRHLAHHRGAS